MASFTRLIRFLDVAGEERLGEAGPWKKGEILPGREVPVLEGDPYISLRRTGQNAKIEQLLSPLQKVPIIIGIGINYQRHADECNLKVPRDPVMFMKPPDALAGPNEDIPVIPRLRGALDYEGELSVIISKDCKQVAESEALEYVLGYSIGNDISARDFQVADVCGGQFCYAKSFDKFAPIGPCIASRQVVSDPHNLQLRTLVNGGMRQQSSTDDLIWSVQKLIAYLSNGMTLRQGTIIMTGTPSGVAAFMKDPDAYLKDGDTIDVEISEIGTLTNRIRWQD